MQSRNPFTSFALVLIAVLATCASAIAHPRNNAKPEALVVWNRHITDFRASFDDTDPAERARRAVARILAVPAEQGTWTVASHEATIKGRECILFTVNGEFVFRLLAEDADQESEETLEAATRAAEAHLREVMESRMLQHRWPLILRGLLISIAITLAFVGSLVLVSRLRRRVIHSFDPLLARARASAVIAGVNLWPILGGLRQVVMRLLTWSVAGILAYLWLALVLEQFPYTEPWGDSLGAFLVHMLSTFGWAILAALPNLLAVLVIFALAQAFNRGVGSYFIAIEHGEVAVPWFAGETARATRQLLALVIWIFAIVVAYPYIPGSGTDAFKGISVFLGLMVSLGSAGLVNQVMSGPTVIYSRAYQRGDYVRIGEHEGRVRNVGLLATKLERPEGNEVSVPNAVVTANTTVNYSRAANTASEMVATSVTIGYDAPWRQVHGLLLLAAKNTPQLASGPAPFVLQRALSDFYVEYQLIAHLLRREERVTTLSRLHTEIQDAFNAHGVQIMSPHYMTQPGEAVVVPRTAWFTEPAVGDARGTSQQ